MTQIKTNEQLEQFERKLRIKFNNLYDLERQKIAAQVTAIRKLYFDDKYLHHQRIRKLLLELENQLLTYKIPML